MDNRQQSELLGQIVQPPAPAEQIRFLTNLQRLLAEGLFTATYKYALIARWRICRSSPVTIPADPCSSPRSLSRKSSSNITGGTPRLIRQPSRRAS